MYYQVMAGPSGQMTINLQATLSASSSMTQNPVIPHHPCTCPGPLFIDFEEDAFWCEHARVGVDDERTKACLIHSIAILLIEIAGETL